MQVWNVLLAACWKIQDTKMMQKSPSVHHCYTNLRILPYFMYVDAAYCYWPSSMVCLSVTVVSPAKTAQPIEMPFALRTPVGPRKHWLHGGCTLVQPGEYDWTLRVWRLCKNGWTNRDAVEGVDSDGPKEPCIRWGGRSPHVKGTF